MTRMFSISVLDVKIMKNRGEELRLLTIKSPVGFADYEKILNTQVMIAIICKA